MKRYTAAGAAAALILLVVLVAAVRGCTAKRDVDAAGYVQADLNLIFQGETLEAQKFLAASDAELEQVYNNGIQAFAENYLTGNVDTEGNYTEAFSYLVKEIFSSMKYQILNETKADDDTYEVTVKYQPADVFMTFGPELKAESEKIEKKAQNGEYEGTDEEVQQSMLAEYLTHAYSLLEEAYLGMQYLEAETFTFTVTADEKNAPSMDEEEINTFIERILELDKL